MCLSEIVTSVVCIDDVSAEFAASDAFSPHYASGLGRSASSCDFCEGSCMLKRFRLEYLRRHKYLLMLYARREQCLRCCHGKIIHFRILRFSRSEESVRSEIKGQMNQIFDILSFAILKQTNAKRTHY